MPSNLRYSIELTKASVLHSIFEADRETEACIGNLCLAALTLHLYVCVASKAFRPGTS
jgi:hypothetical protein